MTSRREQSDYQRSEIAAVSFFLVILIVKKTIIFDLDETLVHCIDDIENNPCDQVINVTFPNGETVQAGINIRPYALDCLRKANEIYQVVVFTASHKAYADVVLDHLDPDRSLI
jgi:CTD small phosphatase-like protein 2